MAHGFAEMLTEIGLEPEQARDLATTVVAAYEGATILARVRRTDEPLHTVSTAMARLIRLSLAEAAAVEANSP